MLHRFKSTLHRVVTRSSKPRLSCACFFDPDFDTVGLRSVDLNISPVDLVSWKRPGAIVLCAAQTRGHLLRCGTALPLCSLAASAGAVPADVHPETEIMLEDP